MKVLQIFIILFFIFSLILFMKFIISSFNDPFIEKELTNVVEPLTLNGSNAFCEVNAGYSLEKGCNKLTKYNCGLTSCCAWVNDKCKAVNKKGLMFFEK